MKRNQAVFLVLVLLFPSCTDLGVGPIANDTGTVFFSTVEGGAWGIRPDSGDRDYRVRGRLPDEFRVEGLRVEFFGVINDQPSTYMWGIALDLVWIKKAG